MVRAIEFRSWQAVLVISIVITSGMTIAALTLSGQQLHSGYIYSFSRPACVLQTSDGGYVILGNRETILRTTEAERMFELNRVGSSPLVDTILLVKTDAYGNKEWSREFGGENGYGAKSVQQTSDGGYVILASLRNVHEDNGPPGFYEDDIWLVKVEASGDIQWNRTYGGPGSERPDSVLQTSDGGYIMAATTRSYGAGSNDFWLVKADQNGNTEWNRTYGWSTVDTVSSFQKTSDGGYLVAGTIYEDALITRYHAFCLVKTDQEGAVLWNATYALGNPQRLGFALETSFGGYIMGGIIGKSTLNGTDTPIGWDFWLLKLDSERNVLWNKTYDAGREESLCSLQLTGDGGFVLVGNIFSYGDEYASVWLVKTDEYGSVAWNKTYRGGGQAYVYSMSSTSDGGYVIAWSSSLVNGVLLMKTDSLGSINCTKEVEF